MLTNSTVSYMYDLADQLNKAGVGIVAVPFTPIGNLVTAATPAMCDYSKKEIQKTQGRITEAISGVTRSDTEFSAHTAAANSLSDQLAENVKRHISVARSVVKPAVISYADAVGTRFQSFQASDPISSFTLEKVYIPEPLLTESLLDDLKIHRGNRITDFPESLRAGPRTTEELTALLFTGLSSVDEEIRTWLSSTDMSVIQLTWDAMFSGLADSQGLYKLKSGDRLSSALAAYLFSRKLTNAPVTVEGMTVAGYNTRVTAIEYYAGALVCEQLTELNQAARTERLILSSSAYGKNVVVYGPVFDKYMEEGGSTEVLFGMLCGGLPGNSLTGVKAVSEKAMTEWNRFITLSNYQNKRDRHELLRTIYASEFVNQLNEPDEFEKEYLSKNPNHADTSVKRTRDYLKELTEEQLEDIGTVALIVIAKYRFGYTNAYQILSDIVHALNANPNLDPREAATIAAINYITDYACAQLQRI